MKKEFECIICPMSCHLEVSQDIDGEVQVKGNSCPRGAAFGKQELLEPLRRLTTTIRIEGALYPLLPVITSANIPKAKIFDIMEVCRSLHVSAPIEVNTVIAENIADSGADLIASRSMERRKVDDRTEDFTGTGRLEDR